MVFAKYVYPRGILCCDYHREHFGDQASFGYKGSHSSFTADRFDPASWLDLFKSGSPVSFPSCGAPRWFSDVCPTSRLIIALEMGAETRCLRRVEGGKQKTWVLHFCTSSHRAEHQFFFSHGKEFTSDIPQEVPRDSLYWPAEPEPKDHFDLTSKPYPSKRILGRLAVANL